MPLDLCAFAPKKEKKGLKKMAGDTKRSCGRCLDDHAAFFPAKNSQSAFIGFGFELVLVGGGWRIFRRLS